MQINSTRDKAILVRLNIGLPGTSKMDKPATAKIKLDHGTDAARVTKQIWPESSLDPIKEVEGLARRYHLEHSLPWDERRFLPQRHFLTYSEQMKKFRDQFETLAIDFINRYDELIEQAKAQLNGLFRPGDYPSRGKLQKKFAFSFGFDPIPCGADLRLDMADEELEVLRADLDNRVAAATHAAQADLYRRLAEPLGKMVERLSDPEHKFKDTLVGNLIEVCNLIPELNLNDDPLLSALVERAKALTSHDPKELRDNAEVRSDVARRADEIVKAMAGLYAPRQEQE